MNIRDLNVGNYYSLFKGNEDGSDCIVEVTSITPYEVGIKGCDKYDSCIAELLFPIPLTREILEKNGFVCDDAYAILSLGDQKYLEYYYYERRLRLIWHGIDEWENHSEVRDIISQQQVSSVHELQNFFRQCYISNNIDL